MPARRYNKAWPARTNLLRKLLLCKQAERCTREATASLDGNRNSLALGGVARMGGLLLRQSVGRISDPRHAGIEIHLILCRPTGCICSENQVGPISLLPAITEIELVLRACKRVCKAIIGFDITTRTIIRPPCLLRCCRGKLVIVYVYRDYMLILLWKQWLSFAPSEHIGEYKHARTHARTHTHTHTRHSEISNTPCSSKR